MFNNVNNQPDATVIVY